jgi:hypothetical protein
MCVDFIWHLFKYNTQSFHVCGLTCYAKRMWRGEQRPHYRFVEIELVALLLLHIMSTTIHVTANLVIEIWASCITHEIK